MPTSTSLPAGNLGRPHTIDEVNLDDLGQRRQWQVEGQLPMILRCPHMLRELKGLMLAISEEGSLTEEQLELLYHQAVEFEKPPNPPDWWEIAPSRQRRARSGEQGPSKTGREAGS